MASVKNISGPEKRLNKKKLSEKKLALHYLVNEFLDKHHHTLSYFVKKILTTYPQNASYSLLAGQVDVERPAEVRREGEVVGPGHLQRPATSSQISSFW